MSCPIDPHSAVDDALQRVVWHDSGIDPPMPDERIIAELQGCGPRYVALTLQDGGCYGHIKRWVYEAEVIDSISRAQASHPVAKK